METHYLYLIIDVFCIVPTLFFSFHPKLQFYKNWNSFFKANLIVASFFILWDSIFTKYGIWWFNGDYTLSYNYFGLPLEEILFFICIPYPCVFTYFTLKKYLSQSKQSIIISYVTISLICFLITISAFNLHKYYTSVTFLVLTILLCYLHFFYKPKWMQSFYISYLFILIPFFISNGILTGGFTKSPVVNYNDYYNLGIRMYTIPVEDTFYGMLLILLNVFLFEKFNEKENNKLKA